MAREKFLRTIFGRKREDDQHPAKPEIVFDDVTLAKFTPLERYFVQNDQLKRLIPFLLATFEWDRKTLKNDFAIFDAVVPPAFQDLFNRHHLHLVEDDKRLLHYQQTFGSLTATLYFALQDLNNLESDSTITNQTELLSDLKAWRQRFLHFPPIDGKELSVQALLVPLADQAPQISSATEQFQSKEIDFNPEKLSPFLRPIYGVLRTRLCTLHEKLQTEAAVAEWPEQLAHLWSVGYALRRVVKSTDQEPLLKNCGSASEEGAIAAAIKHFLSSKKSPAPREWLLKSFDDFQIWLFTFLLEAPKPVRQSGKAIDSDQTLGKIATILTELCLHLDDSRILE